MIIWISRELPLFIFQCVDISSASHIHPSQKLWPFEFAESFCVQFQASRYIMNRNRRSEWNFLTFWISRELPWFIFEHLDISGASHIHPSQKIWPFEFSETFRVQFRALDILSAWIEDSSKKLWPFAFVKSFHGSFFSVSIYHGAHTYTPVKSYGRLNLPRAFVFNFERSIYYASESDIRVKFYDHLNFSRASVVHFRASRYIMGLRHTPQVKRYGYLNFLIASM